MISRRNFLKAGALFFGAPAICKAEWLMPVKPLPSGLLIPDRDIIVTHSPMQNPHNTTVIYKDIVGGIIETRRVYVRPGTRLWVPPKLGAAHIEVLTDRPMQPMPYIEILDRGKQND